MNRIKYGIKTVKEFVRTESPSILTAVGVAGLISTTALAIRATPKAIILLDREENKDLSKYDMFKVVWKCYIPTMAVGGLTAVSILMANSINSKRNAALAGIYSITETAFQEYQEKVIEQIGKGKEEKIRDSISQDRLNKDPLSGREVIFTGKGDTLFYESLSARYFKSDFETIRKIINDFNQTILSREMYKTLNDLYYEMGLEETELGRDMGWDVDAILDIHFSAKIADSGVPCIVIEYKNRPKFL